MLLKFIQEMEILLKQRLATKKEDRVIKRRDEVQNTVLINTRSGKPESGKPESGKPESGKPESGKPKSETVQETNLKKDTEKSIQIKDWIKMMSKIYRKADTNIENVSKTNQLIDIISDDGTDCRKDVCDYSSGVVNPILEMLRIVIFSNMNQLVRK